MFGKKMLQLMYEHADEVNTQLLDLAAELTPTQWDERNPLIGQSLHEVMFHWLAVDEEYIFLCSTGRGHFELYSIADFPDVAALRDLAAQNYRDICAFLASKTEEELAGTVADVMPDGAHRTVVIWRVLLHSLLHTAQHRSEAAAILTGYDKSPGFIDFYGYMWER